MSIGGTSASSPAFAGFIALLNDARISTNKRPLGFLNPLLYTVGIAGLNDITSGSNPGCGTNGFNVSIWSSSPLHGSLTTYTYVSYRRPLDGIQVRNCLIILAGLLLITITLVTGLGTPNFKKLKEIVTSPFLLL